MKVLIDRFSPINNRKWVEEYDIDYCKVQGKTIMDLLVYISNELDPTLSYYSHSKCNHGICMRCILKLNNKNTIACVTKIEKDEDIHLSPLNDSCVKDLICRSL